MEVSVEVRFVEEMAALVPEFRPLLDEHRADYDELLAYLAVADFARLVASAIERDDKPLAEQCTSCLERMASHSDERVSRDLLGAGVFEALDVAQLRRIALIAGPQVRRALATMEPEANVVDEALLEPWHGVSAERRAAFESELARELPVGHVLSGKRVEAIAARSDQDDVLFEVPGLGFTVVHLTWCGHHESSPQWPYARLFATFYAWREGVMLPDHQEFSA